MTMWIYRRLFWVLGMGFATAALAGGLDLREPEVLASASPRPSPAGMRLGDASLPALQGRWLEQLHREMAGGRVPHATASAGPVQPKWVDALRRQLSGRGLTLSPSAAPSPVTSASAPGVSLRRPDAPVMLRNLHR
jgi:hypothetical protein